MNITDILRDHGVAIGTSDILGERLVDGSVGMFKLAQEVQDKINNAATSVVITPVSPEGAVSEYPIGFSIFNVPSNGAHDIWLFYFNIEEVDSTLYTNLLVRTYRTGSEAVQELLVLDDTLKVKYISQRASKNGVFQTIDKAVITYGIPNIEVVNDFTTGGATKAASAETVKILKTELDSVVPAPAYGVERINNNHAIRRFPVFNEWDSDVNYESFEILLPNIALSGEIRVRMVSTTGGAETIIQFVRPTVGAAVTYSNPITSAISYEFAKVFRAPLNITASSSNDWKMLIGILKREKKAPLYVEVELLTTLGNAGDALDATIARMGTQGTTSYLGLIQIGALEKANNAAPKSSVGGTYYVNSTTGNDATGIINSTSLKFKTIAGVANILPSVLNHNITIKLDEGTYPDAAIFNGISGSGIITVIGSNAYNLTDSKKYKIGYLHFAACTIRIDVQGVEFVASSNAIVTQKTNYVNVNYCSFPASNPPTANALASEQSIVIINNSEISGRNTAIWATYFSGVYFTNNTGTGNSTVLNSLSGSKIVKVGNVPSGTLPELAQLGGSIVQG